MPNFVSARWGFGNTWVDVTQRIRQILISGRPVLANPTELRLNLSDPPLDPIPRIQKHLHLTFAGQEREYCIKEGCPIELKLESVSKPESPVVSHNAFAHLPTRDGMTMIFFPPALVGEKIDELPRITKCSALLIRLPHGQGKMWNINLYEAIPKTYASMAQNNSGISAGTVAKWADHLSQCLHFAIFHANNVRKLAENNRIPISNEAIKHEGVANLAKWVVGAHDIAGALLKIGVQISAEVKGIEDFLIDPIEFEKLGTAASDNANRIKVRYAADPVMTKKNPLGDAAGKKANDPRQLFNSGHKEEEGEWLKPPLTLAHISQIAGMDERTAKSFYKPTGLIQKTRQKWTMRLDNINLEIAQRLRSAANAKK